MGVCVKTNRSVLQSILLQKPPPDSTVASLGAPAGAVGGDDYDEMWLNDNLAGHAPPLLFRARIRSQSPGSPPNVPDQARKTLRFARAPDQSRLTERGISFESVCSPEVLESTWRSGSAWPSRARYLLVPESRRDTA